MFISLVILDIVHILTYSSTFAFCLQPDSHHILLFQSGEISQFASEHNREITDIQLSQDSTMLLTASKDHTAKVQYKLTHADMEQCPVKSR